MSEDLMAQFRQEGQPAFDTDTEKDNSASSPEGEETKAETDPSHEGDDSTHDDGQDDEANKDVPFHKHPRWTKREQEWNERFNTQEERHQEDLRKLREEFLAGNKTPESKNENSDIPDWFGGTESQWAAYQKSQEELVRKAREDAIKGITEMTEKEKKAVEEATTYMNSEITAIESDKELNPSGSKIDPNKLLKIVLDNDLIDSKGRWNYRAGFRIMQASATKGDSNETKDRKQIAGAMTAGNKAESKPTPFKTADDFKVNKPW